MSKTRKNGMRRLRRAILNQQLVCFCVRQNGGKFSSLCGVGIPIQIIHWETLPHQVELSVLDRIYYYNLDEIVWATFYTFRREYL